MGVEVLPPRIERGEPKPSASGSRSRYIRKYRALAPPHFHSPIVILCCEMRSAVSHSDALQVVALSAPHLVCGDVGAEGSRRQIWWGSRPQR